MKNFQVFLLLNYFSHGFSRLICARGKKLFHSTIFLFTRLSSLLPRPHPNRSTVCSASSLNSDNFQLRSFTRWKTRFLTSTISAWCLRPMCSLRRKDIKCLKQHRWYVDMRAVTCRHRRVSWRVRWVCLFWVLRDYFTYGNFINFNL